MKGKTDLSKLTVGLQDKKISRINDFCIVTDKVSYDELDQVFPLHPENQFYIDELDKEKVKNARVLEIGTGSGVLAIAAARAGASYVTTLEINPRAKIFAGFNILANGVEDKIELKDGDNDDIFTPVQGKRFDYIISNPPFEPTPRGVEYYLHSSGGMYGLDFVERILKEVDKYMTPKSHAQIVTFSPGNKHEPSLLIELAEKYLRGAVKICVNPLSMRFNKFVYRFADTDRATSAQVDSIKEDAAENGITHLYMCMLHYEKRTGSFTVEKSKKIYTKWDLPIGSLFPMGKRE